MKNSIQKPLLAIMLLFGAMNMNVQCSETDGGSAPARQLSAEQEAKAHELYALLFESLEEIANESVAFAQANQQQVEEVATFWLGEEQLQKLTQMLLSQIPQETGLTGVSIEKLIKISLQLFKESGTYGFTFINKKIFKSFAHQIFTCTGVEVTEFIKNELLKIKSKLTDGTEEDDTTTIESTETTDLEKLVTLIGIELSLLFHEESDEREPLNPEELKNYNILPQKHFQKIIQLSKVNKKIFFVEHTKFATQLGCIIGLPFDQHTPNPDAFNATILHEIGHIKNNSSEHKRNVYLLLAKFCYQITKSSLPVKKKLMLLMMAPTVELILSKLDEYLADNFMLETATIKELKYIRDDFKQDVQQDLQHLKALSACDYPESFNEQDIECIGKLCLGIHPSFSSRIQRIEKRIKELEEMATIKAIERTEAGERSELVHIFSQHRSRL